MDQEIKSFSTDSEAAFQHDIKHATRLCMVANSYAFNDAKEPLVIYHLEDIKDPSRKFVAIHKVKSVEIMLADYMKAKAKLDFLMEGLSLVWQKRS